MDMNIDENEAIKILGISRDIVLDFQKKIMLKGWAVFFIMFSMVIFTGEFSNAILFYFFKNAGDLNFVSSTLFLITFAFALAYSKSIFKKSEKIIKLRYFNYPHNKKTMVGNESVYLFTGFVIAEITLNIIKINDRILISNMMSYFVYITFGYFMLRALRNCFQRIPITGYISILLFFMVLTIQIIINFFVKSNNIFTGIIMYALWILLIAIWILSAILFYDKAKNFRGDINT